MELGRWQSPMERLGVAENHVTFDALQTAYAEPHRAYHTAEHIDACLGHLDQAVALAEQPDVMEIALWFHDAVYATRAQDNERRSAQWASEFLGTAGAPNSLRDQVARHVIATEHDTTPDDPDSALLVDIDLAILGSAPEAYQVFETNIRREYKWVPGPLFRRKRAEVLEGFLNRRTIYATEHFQSRSEITARRNLKMAIAALR